MGAGTAGYHRDAEQTGLRRVLWLSKSNRGSRLLPHAVISERSHLCCSKESERAKRAILARHGQYGGEQLRARKSVQVVLSLSGIHDSAREQRIEDQGNGSSECRAL